MAAILSASGTWTALATPTTGQTTGQVAGSNPSHAGNVPLLLNAASADFGTVPTEVTQIVQLVMQGYGLAFWPACVLLRSWLTALVNTGAPR